MVRLARIAPADVAVHVIQRGNNRQHCFMSDADHRAYIGWLEEYSRKYEVDIHAWVMMSNHVHLLCTPRQSGALSRMMQAQGRQYVRYFNRKYKRTGTLWEGRYRSCLVQSEKYLLQVYCYIELNPVRAGMVKKPDDYNWSSYGANAEGIYSTLCTPHPEFTALGRTARERMQNYRALFPDQVEDSDFLQSIRKNTNKGLVLGYEQFKNRIETLTGRRVVAGKRGRPEGWKKPSA